MWVTAFLVVLNVALPLAAFGGATAVERWKSWRARASVETSDPTPVYPNQSLLAALKRVLTVAGGARDPVRYAIAAWPTSRVVHLFYAIAGAVVFALAISFRRHPPGLAHPSLLNEVAVALILMTLFSPLAWKAHFVTLLAAYWLIWRVIQGRKERLAWVTWWASFACLTLSAPALIGGQLRAVLESLNVITVGALLVLALTLWTTQPQRQPRASGVEPSLP
jgi:hypothetical protein